MIKEFLKSILTPVFIVLAAMLGIMGVAGMFLVIFYIIYLIVLGFIFIYDYFVGMTYGKTKYDPLFKDFAYRKRRSKRKRKDKKSCLDQNYIGGQISYISDDGALRYSWDGKNCIDNMRKKDCSVIGKEVFGNCDGGNMTNGRLVITIYTLDAGYSVDENGNDVPRFSNEVCLSSSVADEFAIPLASGGTASGGVFLNSSLDSEGVYGPGFMPRESRIEIAPSSQGTPAILAPCDKTSLGFASGGDDLSGCIVGKNNVQTFYIDNDLGEEEEDYNVYYCSEGDSTCTISSIKFSLFKSALSETVPDANEPGTGVNARMTAALAIGPLLVEMKRCSSEDAVINEYIDAYNSWLTKVSEDSEDSGYYSINYNDFITGDISNTAISSSTLFGKKLLAVLDYKNNIQQDQSNTITQQQNSALGLMGLYMPNE